MCFGGRDDVEEEAASQRKFLGVGDGEVEGGGSCYVPFLWNKLA